MRNQLTVLLLLLLGATNEAAKILALFPVPAKSHFGAFSPYFEGLAKRGHEVTVVSPFPRKTPLANYTDIVLEDTFPPRDSKEFNIFEMREAPFFVMMYFIFNVCYQSCEKVLQLPNMQKLMNREDLEFDLVLYEPFFTQCTYGLLHKFKAPTIQLVPNTIIPWEGDSVGNPSTTSYIPQLLTHSESLDFMDRVTSFLKSLYLQLFRRIYVIPKMEALMRKYFPDPTLPSIEELETNTSFLFLHSHPVLNYPRPLTPNTIEVGALHVKDGNKLPQMPYSFLIVYLLTLGAGTEAARILVIFPLPVNSHVSAYTPYVEELARRGHEVTVVSAFPRKTHLANYTDIVVADTFPARDGEDFNLFAIKDVYYVAEVWFIFNLCYTSCEKFLREPNIQKLINSNNLEFDLIVYESFYTECIYGFLHKFKATSIKIIPNTVVPWHGHSVGNPSTLSYVPVLLSNTDVLDFKGRFVNFLRQQFVNLFRKLYVIPKMDKLMRKHFTDPTIPNIEELDTNTAFLFLHSHPILNYPRPYTPNTIEVGGLHIKKPQKVPQDLQIFLDSASDGLIYFSLGSNVRGVDMPEIMRTAILKCFSKLKQKVLWKIELDTLHEQPKNVRLAKWFPQHDVLAHPNTKLFISHAGLMSIQEATYFGVPLIVIPIMADQNFNALRVRNGGSALLLDIRNISEESFEWAIQEVLLNPQYHENAERLSHIFKDQPQSPLDRAIFWTEYAIRHKGAPHLRSAALKLNFFQYYSLDVISVLFIIVLVLTMLFVTFLRIVARHFIFKKNKILTKTQKLN